MKARTMKMLPSVLALAVAALLIAPTARAAKSGKTPRSKPDPEAQSRMSEGLASLERGETSAAVAAFNKAARAQGTVSSYFLLGWAHYQRGFKLGSVETADRDDARSAIDAYTMALALDTSLKELPDASRLHFSMALCYEALSSYDQALDSYKAALRSAPDKALIPLHAARLRLKMKDGAKAISNIELALRTAEKIGSTPALRGAARNDPAFASLVADAPARKALGIGAAEELRDAVRDAAPKPAGPIQDPAVLDKIAEGNTEFQFRRYLSAVAAYHEALARDRESRTLGAAQAALVYEKIGAASNKLGQADTAAHFLQKALQQNPMNPSAHYQIALAYALSGKTASALSSLRESFAACADPAELRLLMMQAKTDPELEAVRDFHGFRSALAQYADRVVLR